MNGERFERQHMPTAILQIDHMAMIFLVGLSRYQRSIKKSFRLACGFKDTAGREDWEQAGFDHLASQRAEITVDVNLAATPLFSAQSSSILLPKSPSRMSSGAGPRLFRTVEWVSQFSRDKKRSFTDPIRSQGGRRSTSISVRLPEFPL